MSKKEDVLTEIFLKCQNKNNYIFHNDLVKSVSKKHRFGNPFDATKIDNQKKIPKILLENDYAIIHMGGGKHQFIKGINKIKKIQNELSQSSIKISKSKQAA